MNGLHIRCPSFFRPADSAEHRRTLFLGGGITGVGEWQKPAAQRLAEAGLIVFNPRREDFDAGDPSMTEAQIEWEFYHLRMARARMFWFPPETLCPITLFELGKYCEKADPLWVGCHPDYKRRSDLKVQLKLARPSDGIVHDSLDETTAIIREWADRSFTTQ